jgi:hypothetical protein
MTIIPNKIEAHWFAIFNITHSATKIAVIVSKTCDYIRMEKNYHYVPFDLCVDFDCSKTISCI